MTSNEQLNDFFTQVGNKISFYRATFIHVAGRLGHVTKASSTYEKHGSKKKKTVEAIKGELD